MATLVTNNATTTLAGSITNVATALTVTAGQGALFPAITGPDIFYATLIDASNNLEIVKVTARATDTFTVVRAQDGTTARAFSTGDRVELRPTAALFNNKLDKDTGGTVAGALTVTGTLTASGTLQVNGATFLGDASGDAVTFNASTANVPNGLTYTGGLVNFAGGLQRNGVVVADISSVQTLTNKTLDTASGNVLKINGNTLAAAAGTATVTLPAVATTLVGRDTTDTLINKTLTAPVVTGGLTTDSFAGAGVAAGADVIAGTSTTKLVTPASLASDITKAVSGHIVHPGGVIENWGVVSCVGGSSATITWDKAFSSACYVVSVTAQTTATNISNWGVVISYSTTGAVVARIFSGGNNETNNMHVRAIGV